MESLVQYNALNALAHQQEWWFGASECYGIITGLVCFDQSPLWSELLFKGEAIEAEFTSLFERLSKHIEQALQSQHLAYQLLLPEEVPLHERAQALVYWAQGFIIASTHAQSEAKTANPQLTLDTDSEEFLRDLQEIVQLDTDLPDSEQNRQLLTDLEEHCRMGALLIYASVRSPSAH